MLAWRWRGSGLLGLLFRCAAAVIGLGLPLVERVFDATWDRCGGAHKGMDAREPPRVSPTPARVAHSPFPQAAAALRALSGLPRVSSDPTLAKETKPIGISIRRSRAAGLYTRFFPRKK